VATVRVTRVRIENIKGFRDGPSAVDRRWTTRSVIWPSRPPRACSPAWIAKDRRPSAPV